MGTNEPYSMGESLFIDPVLALVPRLIWPDKPFKSGDSEFVNRYTGLQFSNDFISVDTNITFEFYANFGWPGVVVGLFVFGYILARLELALFQPDIKITKLIVLAMLLLYLSRGGRRSAAMALELGTTAIAAYGLGQVLDSPAIRAKVFRPKVRRPSATAHAVGAESPAP
jgi:hypothetical protein